MEARLIADGGAAAADPESFFRSPVFLEAEGVTHTISLGDELRLPVIVRAIEGGDRVDAISPYGYPGGSGAPEKPIDPDRIDWSQTGLVSVFVRDRIGEDAPACRAAPFATTSSRRWRRAASASACASRSAATSARGWSRRALTAGPETEPAPGGPSSGPTPRRWRRTGAAERYLYPSEYFERLLGGERSWLALAARGRRAGWPARSRWPSDGYLHYYLGGTADEALEDSPMKNLFAAMIALDPSSASRVNLGGGLAPGDSLDDFKRGFADGEAPFSHPRADLRPGRLRAARGAGGPTAGGFLPRVSRLAGDAAAVVLAVLLPALALGEMLDPLLHGRRDLRDQGDHRARPGRQSGRA